MYITEHYTAHFLCYKTTAKVNDMEKYNSTALLAQINIWRRSLKQMDWTEDRPCGQMDVWPNNNTDQYIYSQ